MANQVNVDSVSVSFGLDPVLRAVSVGVDDGDRIGVVGRNGSGKSTLLEVLGGRRTPDTGRVSARGGLRLAMVTQTDEMSDRASVREAITGRPATAEHEWAADPAVRAVVEGLGLTRLGLDIEVGRLSGGERRRVALAAALVSDADLLVLDEPTNHLDIEGIGWLAEHLIARNAALVVVTHDRWFLDTVCTRTWEVVDGRVNGYDGGYADWIFARAERQRQADAAEERRRNLARKELAWLRRGPPARTSKPRFRIEAANALIADVPAPRDKVELVALARGRLGRTVLELEDVTVEVGGRTLLDRASWQVGPGDRIGILGPNGAGKTTLLGTLTGQLEPVSGTVLRGSTVRIGQLAQELAVPDGDVRVLTAVEEVARQIRLGSRELSASQLLERFGFPARTQWLPVRDLSGGQRRRLQLVRTLVGEPNVLVLDEPTNDLDVDTLAALEDLLDSWAGTLLVVSHDRHLLERVCDDVVAVFGDGKVTHLPRGVEEYLERVGSQGAGSGAGSGSVVGKGSADVPGGGRAAGSPSQAARTREARRDMQRLERQMESLGRKEERLHAALVEAATDYARLSEVDAELRTLQAEKAELEAQWYDAVERSEQG